MRGHLDFLTVGHIKVNLFDENRIYKPEVDLDIGQFEMVVVG